MSNRRPPQISGRKTPQQARSTELVTATLEAARQVLANEGPRRFTMARVAERAGVSVGSLYQYFPNKASILFRLQSDEWRTTSRSLCAILEDADRSPFDRLRELVHAFIRSECEEAQVRLALSASAPSYGSEPEAQETRAAWNQAVRSFMSEILPSESTATRDTAIDLFSSTLSALGKRFSQQPRTTQQIEAYADPVADMLCAYLRWLGTSGSKALPDTQVGP
jgi:AcrR family transcriptional regulator